jgi:hypothetical protein
MRPQESFHIQPQIPTPAKTLTFLSSQQVLALPEPKPTHAILGRLDETEEACTRWLAEVRNKKIHYRRMLAQQELDRKDIEDDMARLEQLEPIIQVMAAEELHKVDVAIRVQEEEANELREQQKELRQRVLNFEHLKQAFEEERQLGL